MSIVNWNSDIRIEKKANFSKKLHVPDFSPLSRIATRGGAEGPQAARASTIRHRHRRGHIKRDKNPSRATKFYDVTIGYHYINIHPPT